MRLHKGTWLYQCHNNDRQTDTGACPQVKIIFKTGSSRLCSMRNQRKMIKSIFVILFAATIVAAREQQFSNEDSDIQTRNFNDLVKVNKKSWEDLMKLCEDNPEPIYVGGSSKPSSERCVQSANDRAPGKSVTCSWALANAVKEREDDLLSKCKGTKNSHGKSNISDTIKNGAVYIILDR